MTRSYAVITTYYGIDILGYLSLQHQTLRQDLDRRSVWESSLRRTFRPVCKGILSSPH